MTRQVLFGTRNQAKIEIVRAAIQSLPIEILTLDDLGIDIDVREDGLSTEENAEKKARLYFAESGIPTVGIDGGLRVDKFPNEKQPGVWVRRICHGDRDVTDEEMLAYYIEELRKVGGESVATWKGSIALVTWNEKVLADSFSYQTILTAQRRGNVMPGAPLDVVMMDPVTGKYYTGMKWEERPDTRWLSGFFQRHMAEL